MIRDARKADKSEIYDLWKLSYPNQNRNYLNFYFKNLFDKGVCIVQEQDHRIISSIQMNEHVLRLRGKYLAVSYLLGISTLPDYRRRGHMKALMEAAIDEAKRNHLITLVKALNPKLHERFGFETVYYHKSYTLHREHLSKITPVHVSYSAEAGELLSIYQEFTKHFDGCYERDTIYFSLLLNELMMNQKKIVIYRDPAKGVRGYLVYKKHNHEVIVKEAVYLESIALMRMLKDAIGNEDEIVVEVSSNEKLETVFPMVIPKKQAVMMARINDYELFNKLYNVNVKTVKEAFSLVKKPLWNHEYY